MSDELTNYQVSADIYPMTKYETRQDDIDPKSENQFSSFMSYHEGESSSLDPGTNEKELCKSPIEDSTKRHDSGVVEISTHMMVM